MYGENKKLVVFLKLVDIPLLQWKVLASVVSQESTIH